MHARAMLRSLAIASAGVGLAACTVGDVELDGKSCPCPESSGLVCNESTRTCVDIVGCTPRFVVSDFGHVWATPNQVRWEWQPPDSGDDFGTYTIELARSAEAIEAGNPEQRLDKDELPELGYYALPNTGDKNEVVRGSVTHGLAAGTTWYARLVAVDRFGCPYRSPIAPATTTLAPSAEMIIFDDEPVEVLFSDPGTFAFQENCDGEACMAATWGAPSDGKPGHTNNLRVRPYIAGSDLAAVISEGQFENPAFLEMRIWLEDPGSSYWTSVWLLTSADNYFRFEPYSPVHTPPEPAQSSYRTVQIPLLALIGDKSTKPMTYTDLTSTLDGGVEEVSFGANLPTGKRGWIDDIRLRW
jgi:hypothetical protein